MFVKQNIKASNQFKSMAILILLNRFSNLQLILVFTRDSIML